VSHTLYVPVRIGSAGIPTLRTGRLESGERIGLAFTSPDSLSFTLGAAQQWVNLGDQSLRDMLTPLGIRQLRIDALPFGQPGTGGVPRQARRRPAPHPYAPLAPARTAAWAMTFRSLPGRSLSGHHRQRLSPWSVQGHHKARLKVGTIERVRLPRPAPAGSRRAAGGSGEARNRDDPCCWTRPAAGGAIRYFAGRPAPAPATD
jgi:hypothetical protein